jgi:hypothetical protein
LDAAVVGQENVIIAAKAPHTIGQGLQDSAWSAARATEAEVMARGLESGKPALTIIEPLRDRDRIVAWVRLVFGSPEQYAAPRAADDLAVEVARFVIPFFLVMALLSFFTLRGIMSKVRVLIARVVRDAMEPEESMSGHGERYLRTGLPRSQSHLFYP